LFTDRAFADCLAQASRLVGLRRTPPSTATLRICPTRQPLPGKSVSDYVVEELRAGRLRFADTDPDDPANVPRVMTVWRANLLGFSGKGMEYFMRHLLGVEDAVRAQESPPQLRPKEVTWREQVPRGKLDLVTTIDFRMTSTCTSSDVYSPRRPGMRSTTCPPPTCTPSCTP